jgi:acyl-coenzyme A thioesterase PaaI-like protein
LSHAQRVAIQDLYPENVAHCYGCGRLNDEGLHIKSYAASGEAPAGSEAAASDETVCHFVPRPYHTAIPGYVYGGLLASLVDCHGTGTAAIAAYRAEGREPGSEPPLRFVTASLKVDFLRPTPLGPVLELRGRPRDIQMREGRVRRVVLEVELSVEGQLCVRGEVVCARMPEGLTK